MNLKYMLPKVMAILIVFVVFASCEEDFNTIGSDIVDENFTSELYNAENLIAYSRKLAPVQTNNLPLYQLGVYTDPVYGKTTANLLSQVTLSAQDPDFGDCTVLDSVVLYMPFFSESNISNEEITFKIDSVFGSDPITISIYESNYFLRDLDPETNFEEQQKYYSDQGPLFDQFQGELIHTIEDFTPTNEGIVLSDSVTLAPGLRAKLPLEFFQEKIFDMEGSSELINNNNFREYFRGLYFKVESSTGDGSLFLFDLNNADNTPDTSPRVDVYYRFKTLSAGEACEDLEETIDGTFRLDFSAVSVNTFQHEFNPTIADALNANPNITEGEPTLYVKGGTGAISIIELFGEDQDNNGVADELEFLRDQKWLINEANLIFYVDKDKVVGGDAEPERLVIFDIANGTFLADINLDPTANEEPFEALVDHFGPLERGSDGNGRFYKIRVTNHISNLINRDSTNNPLGLMVSQNVLELAFQDLRNSQAPGIESVPAASIIAPKGTVLHGNTSANEQKRLKLQIFYTEPN